MPFSKPICHTDFSNCSNALHSRKSISHPVFCWLVNDICSIHSHLLGHCVDSLGLSKVKVVRNSCARCVLDVSCMTFISGVVGSDCVFTYAPCLWEDVGMCKSDFKIYVPIGVEILGIVDTVQKVPLLRTCQNQYMWSVDIARGFRRALKFTHRFTSCCAVYDPVKTLAVSLYSPVQTHCAIGSNI